MREERNHCWPEGKECQTLLDGRKCSAPWVATPRTHGAFLYVTAGGKLEPMPESQAPYKHLLTYQYSFLIFHLNEQFTSTYLKDFADRRTKEQRDQTARSGKQNIAEGSMASGTSKKTEIKLVGIARASFEELLQDFEDFLRQKGLKLWGKDSLQAKKIRSLAHMTNRSYTTYKTYVENTNPEIAANTLICLIHQTNFLLDRQLKALEKDFLEKGGFTERLYAARTRYRLKEKLSQT